MSPLSRRKRSARRLLSDDTSMTENRASKTGRGERGREEGACKRMKKLADALLVGMPRTRKRDHDNREEKKKGVAP